MKKLYNVQAFLGIALALSCSGLFGFTPSTGSSENRIGVSGLVDTISSSQYLVHTMGANPASESSLASVYTNGFSKLVLARFAEDGSVDTNFNTSGSLELDSTDVTSLTQPATLLLTKVVKYGNDYVLFGSNRNNGTDSSQLFFMDIAQDGSTISSEASFTHSTLTGAYDGSGTALYTINDIDLRGDVAYMVGSIQEDPDGSGSFDKQGWIGAYNISDQSWKVAPTLFADSGNDAELTKIMVNANTSGSETVLAAGYNGLGIAVQQYTITGSLAAPSSLSLEQTYTTGSAGDKPGALGLQGDSPILVVAHAVEYDPILQEKISVERLAINVSNIITGSIDTTFADNGVRVLYFDDVPQSTPLGYNPQLPAYTYENNHFDLQVASDGTLFIAGTIADKTLPFVYKLTSGGLEVDNFAQNYRYGINDNNELVGEIVSSSVWYPVVGQTWETSLATASQMILDETNNWLYLFGSSGSLHKSTTENSIVNFESNDLIRRVSTGNVTVTADLSDVKMNVVYSDQEIQLSVMDNIVSGDTDQEAASNISGASTDISFANFKLYSNAGVFSSTGAQALDVYGTVEVTRNSLATGQRNVASEVVTVIADNTNALTVNVQGGTGPTDPFRIYEGDDTTVCNESNAPTTANGAISQGKLVGTMKDGTQLEFTITSLSLRETETLGLGSEITGDAYVKLTNTYSHEENNYTLTLDNSLFQTSSDLSLTNDIIAPTTKVAKIKKMELDLVENPTSGTQNIFGYMEIYSDEFTELAESDASGWINFPVFGELAQTMTDNQFDGDFTEGDISNLDSIVGSYVQGRSPYGRVTVGLKRASNYTTDPQNHEEIRSGVTLEVGATLSITNTYTSSSAVLNLDNDALATITDLHSDFSITESNIVVEDVSTGISRTFIPGQQHSLSLSVQVPVTWTHAGQTTTIPVGGVVKFLVRNDGTITRPDNFVLKGTLQESNHDPITLYVRVNTFDITQTPNT